MAAEDPLYLISQDIASGNVSGVSDKIKDLADSLDDPFEIIKCMSMLKLVPQDGTESKIANRLVGISDATNGLEIASALRNLDCPTFALEVLKKVEPNDQSNRLKCHCYYEIEEYESALEVYGLIKNQCINDRILLSKIQSAVGEHSMSIKTSTELLQENPADYDVRIAYVTSLLMGGHDKEAAKYARDAVKDKSADSNAIAAYVLRISGNIKAAGGYASRAVQLNPEHIGAMETLGICLALKGEIQKAKIVAGAINEISPGDKAAINVLSYCDGQ